MAKRKAREEYYKRSKRRSCLHAQRLDLLAQNVARVEPAEDPVPEQRQDGNPAVVPAEAPPGLSSPSVGPPLTSTPQRERDLYQFLETDLSPVRRFRPRQRPDACAGVPPTQKALAGRRVVSIRELIEEQIQADRHKGGFGCSFMDSVFEKEVREGFSSKLTYRCKMCNVETVLRTDTPGGLADVNDAMVTGTLAGGGSYAALSQLAAAANMPCMSQSTYIRHERSVGDAVEKAALESMLRAGQEERDIAIREGNVDSDGVPLVTVISDGMWGKRSYKNKYNALSGTASIVGWRTKKVLFSGVRNKHCFVCALAKYRGRDAGAHTCYANWTGPSTSMEQDIIAEGFHKSEEMHGLKFYQLIADGDSSVHRRLLETMPYGPRLLVEKIECKNHLLRNLRSAIIDLSKDTKLQCPRADKKKCMPALRQLIGSSMKRLSGGISRASLHRQTESGSMAERIASLRADILNCPSHVFGDHSACAQYFCDRRNAQPAQPSEESENEPNMVPQLIEVGLWNPLMRLMNKMADRAGSLIHNVNNNMCEVVNSVIAKFLSGKRLFYSGRSSFNLRCSAAVLSMNTSGGFHRQVHKTLQSGVSPGFFTSKFERGKKRRLASSRARKLSFKDTGTGTKKRPVRPAQGPDRHYGGVEEDEDEPEPEPLQELEDKVQEFLSGLKLSPEERTQLQVEPQATPKWMQERRKRLTASNFGVVCRRKATTSVKSLVHTILYGCVKTAAMRHGQTTEEVARDKLRQAYGLDVLQCGLWVDEERPYLAASPDGIIGCDKVVEIKCPTTAGEYPSAVEAVQAGKIPYLDVQGDGTVQLKTSSHYYHQVQGQLHITGKETCVFFIYTAKWEILLNISRDDEFWKNHMEDHLEKFYMQALLPELASPRWFLRRKRNDIREAPYVLAAQDMPKKPRKRAAPPQSSQI